jgi:hypothetical protein
VRRLIVTAIAGLLGCSGADGLGLPLGDPKPNDPATISPPSLVASSIDPYDAGEAGRVDGDAMSGDAISVIVTNDAQTVSVEDASERAEAAAMTPGASRIDTSCCPAEQLTTKCVGLNLQPLPTPHPCCVALEASVVCACAAFGYVCIESN